MTEFHFSGKGRNFKDAPRYLVEDLETDSRDSLYILLLRILFNPAAVVSSFPRFLTTVHKLRMDVNILRHCWILSCAIRNGNFPVTQCPDNNRSWSKKGCLYFTDRIRHALSHCPSSVKVSLRGVAVVVARGKSLAVKFRLRDAWTWPKTLTDPIREERRTEKLATIEKGFRRFRRCSERDRGRGSR